MKKGDYNSLFSILIFVIGNDKKLAKTTLDIKTSEKLRFSIRDIVFIPLCFLLISLVFFLFSYLYFPIVFDIFIMINLGLQIISFFNIILFGYITLLIKPKKYQPPKEYPAISIVIAVYNDGKILNETLKNLVNLKYPHYNIIIVYSEKSTDNTYEIAEYYTDNYDFIRMIPENISAANAKNIGFENSTSKYVLVLDSDTYIKDGFLEDAVAAMEYDEDLVVIQARNLGLNTNQNRITRVLWCLNTFTTFFLNGTNKIFKVPCYRGYGAIWRRNFVLEAGKFSLNELLEDFEFCYRIMANYPKRKALYYNDYDVYDYFPTTLKDLYFQQLRWIRGAISLNIRYFFSFKKTSMKYHIVFFYNFLYGVFIPLIGFISLGMYIIQFFLSFIIQRTFLSLGSFLLYFGVIVVIFTFIGYYNYASAAYSKVLSRRDLLYGIIIIMIFLSPIYGVIVTNAMWKNLKREKKQFVKVSKENFRVNA